MGIKFITGLKEVHFAHCFFQKKISMENSMDLVTVTETQFVFMAVVVSEVLCKRKVRQAFCPPEAPEILLATRHVPISRTSAWQGGLILKKSLSKDVTSSNDNSLPHLLPAHCRNCPGDRQCGGSRNAIRSNCNILRSPERGPLCPASMYGTDRGKEKRFLSRGWRGGLQWAPRLSDMCV